MEITTYLWIFTFSLLGIIVILSLIYCAAIFCRHKAHKKRDIELFEKNVTLPAETKNICISLVERRYSTIQNYFIYQVINKVFGFTGVIYSVLGFGAGLLNASSEVNDVSLKYLCAAISLVSIISVIIALYMSPTKRVAEYINAWRRYDQKISEMSGRLSTYKKMTSREKTIILRRQRPFRKCKVATEDIVIEVSKFIFDVESSINSECE